MFRRPLQYRSLPTHQSPQDFSHGSGSTYRLRHVGKYSELRSLTLCLVGYMDRQFGCSRRWECRIVVEIIHSLRIGDVALTRLGS